MTYTPQVWHYSKEQQTTTRALARDAAHGLIFLLAVALVIVGGILSHPADLGLLAFAVTMFGLVGIARA